LSRWNRSTKGSEMRRLFVLVLATACTGAFADGESGRVKVCRDPTIDSIASKLKVVPLIGDVQFQANRTDDESLWISVSNLQHIGPSGECQVMAGTVTENKFGRPVPKKGSRWVGDATAAPGTWWGKNPTVETKTKIVGDYEVTSSSSSYDSSKGGQISSVPLRITALEDFK
jgi:hypothetical protein